MPITDHNTASPGQFALPLGVEPRLGEGQLQLVWGDDPGPRWEDLLRVAGTVLGAREQGSTHKGWFLERSWLPIL